MSSSSLACKSRPRLGPFCAPAGPSKDSRSPLLRSAWYVGNGAVVRRFTLVALVACYLSNTTKDLLKLPRPPPQLHVQKDSHVAHQPGFPSTHSAHAISLALALASEASRSTWAPAKPAEHQVGLFLMRNAWRLVAFHTPHVCLSRLYMGVHSLADIVGGLVIGFAVAAVDELCGARVDSFTVESPARYFAVAASSETPARGVPSRLPRPRRHLSASPCGPSVVLCSRWRRALATAVAAIAADCGLARARPAVVGVTALLYPDRRPSNSAFTEMLLFCGVHLGTALPTAVPGLVLHGRPEHPRDRPYPMLALQFLVGLVALALFRMAVGTASKRLAHKLVPPAALPAALAARGMLVAVASAWWVCAVHPSRFV